MQGTEIVRAELERLFELDDLKSFAKDLLGFDPEAVGGTLAKASFAGALTAYCQEHDAIEALCDALLATRPGSRSAPRAVSVERARGRRAAQGRRALRRVHDHAASSGKGGSLSSTWPSAEDAVPPARAPRRAARDKRGLHRFLALNRLLSVSGHEGLPAGTEAGEVSGRYYVHTTSSTGRRLRRASPAADRSTSTRPGRS